MAYKSTLKMYLLLIIISNLILLGCKQNKTTDKSALKGKGFVFKEILNGPSNVQDVLMKGKDTIICLTFEQNSFKVYFSFDHAHSWKVDTIIQDEKLAYPRPELNLSEDKKSVQLKLNYDDELSPKTITEFYSKRIDQKSWIEPFENISKKLSEIKESVIVTDSTYYLLDNLGKVYFYNKNSRQLQYIFKGYEDLTYQYLVALRKKNDKLLLYLGQHNLIYHWTKQTIYIHSIKQDKTDSICTSDKTTIPNLYIIEPFLKWNDRTGEFRIPALVNNLSAGDSYYLATGKLNQKNIKTDSIIDDRSIVLSYQKVSYCLYDSTISASIKVNKTQDRNRFYYYTNEDLVLKTGINSDRSVNNKIKDTKSGYFEYSWDKGNVWYLLATPKKCYNQISGEQDPNIYLLDSTSTLFGYCQKNSDLPQVSNFNYTQFGNKLNLKLDLNSTLSKARKIKFFISDSTLINKLNVDFLNLDSSSIQYNDHEIKASLDLTSLPYKIAGGAHLNLFAEIYSGKDQMVTHLGRVTYKIFSLDAYLKYIYIISGVLIFYLSLFIVSIKWPLILLTFYNSKLYPLLDEIPGFFGDVVKKVNKFLFFRLFVGTDRALSAWTWKYKEGFTTSFENDKAVIERTKYVQIPLSERLLSGELVQTVKEPDIDYFYKLLYRTDRPKNIIQIIGNGGSGKTSLACMICKLLSNSVLLLETGHIQTNFILPLFVDEETTDVPSLLRKKICESVGELNEDFLNSLLKGKKFLVIIDALSEKTDEMKNHLTDIIRFDEKFSNVLITSRKEFDFPGNSSLLLFPEPLTSENVMAFTKDLLKLNGIVQFDTLNSQALLALKLSRIIKFKAREMQITPLVIKLAVEKIIELFKNFVLDNTLSFEDNIVNTIEKLPASIPELHTDYVKSVNKPYDGLFIPDLDLLDIIKVISFLCLSDNFTPKETEIDFVKKELRTSFSRYSLDEILTILDKNGIVKINKPSSNIFLLSFILDPLCENFAAFYFAELNGNDYFKWDKLYSKLLAKGEQSKGFAQALLLIHITYYIQKNWINPESIISFSALAKLMVESAN